MSKKESWASTLVFAAILLITGTLVFFYLPLYGKSNIWKVDGLTQHFATLIYFNRLVRAFIAHPSAGFPMWSWELGLGADTLSSLAHYVIGDPFVLISFLFPMRHIDIAYEIMFFARMFCAGIFGFLYMRKMGATSVAASVGSLVYVFTTFALAAGMRHPFFINAMVFLPLILIGIEKVFQGHRPYLLIGSVFMAAITNFYFFYMLVIITVVYAIVRFVEITPKGQRLVALPKALLHVALPYALGTALAAVVLVPVLMAVFSTARASSSKPLQLFYPLREYGAYVTSILANTTGPNSAYMGYSVIALLLAPVLLMRLKKNFTVRVMAVLFAVFLALPLFGWLFNGFTFPNNRYLFAWGLFLGTAVALVLTDPRPLTRNELLVSFGLLGVFTFAVMYADPLRSLRLPVVLGASMLALLALENLGVWAKPIDRIGPRVFAEEWCFSAVRWAVLGLVILNLATNGMARFDRRYTKYLDSWENYGAAEKAYQKDPGSLAKTLPKDGFYRVEKQTYVDRNYSRPVSANDPIVQGYNGTAFYISLMDAHMTAFLDEVQNRSAKLGFAFAGFDDRAALLSVLGVKYYIATDHYREFVPYGFVPIKRVGKATVYRNLNALPLGFVYPKTISYAEWAQMAPLEKQQLLLQGAVVDDSAALGLPSADTSTGITSIKYSATATGSLTFRQGLMGRIDAGKKPRILTLHFKPLRDQELYIELNDIDFHKKIKPQKVSSGTPALMRELMAFRRSQIVGKLPPRISVGYQADSGAIKWERWDTPAALNRHIDEAQLVNLGYRRTPIDYIQVRPDQKGIIDFSTLNVYGVRMDSMRSQVKALARGGLDHTKIAANTMSGEVNSPYRGVLFLSIPFSTGWSATVDGKAARIIRVNEAFSGIVVDRGTHAIRMRYVTPGLKTGALVSGLALVALCGMVYFQEHARRVRRDHLGARAWRGAKAGKRDGRRRA